MHVNNQLWLSERQSGTTSYCLPLWYETLKRTFINFNIKAQDNGILQILPRALNYPHSMIVRFCRWNWILPVLASYYVTKSDTWMVILRCFRTPWKNSLRDLCALNRRREIHRNSFTINYKREGKTTRLLFQCRIDEAERGMRPHNQSCIWIDCLTGEVFALESLWNGVWIMDLMLIRTGI